MNDPSHDDLRNLLERFADPSAADAIEREIREGERLLAAHPAPPVAPETLAAIKQQMATRLDASHRSWHPLYRYAALAAAVVLTALIGFFGRPVAKEPDVSFASLIPTAIWESDDLASDDMELAYFQSELQRLETQMQAIEDGDGDLVATASLDEVEMEMIRIDREFWKE